METTSMKQTSFEDKMKDADEAVYHAEMAAMTLPKYGMCIVDDKTAVMDKVYFEELGEYSLSLPTGKYFGKRWKRELYKPGRSWSECSIPYDPPRWWMGEYYDMHSKDQIGIYWRKIILL